MRQICYYIICIVTIFGKGFWSTILVLTHLPQLSESQVFFLFCFFKNAQASLRKILI